MKELMALRITEDMPGTAVKYVLEARLIDKNQGTHIGESGLEIWNYDKSFSMSGDDLKRMIKIAGDTLTEVICE